VGKDIWYKYRPAATGTVQVSTCGANFDTVLAAYDATLSGVLTPIICSDDACGLSSSISFAVVAGRPRANFYIIRVGGYLGASGSAMLQVNGPDCDATNDDCALATPICPGTTRYSTVGAMSEYSLPCQATADVWFVYAPATSGSATVDTCAAASY